eukprot:NODE_1346_length_1575_cov_25.923329_g1209_i0.p1 GENE.NODE_1346_length_1575_cov_25.923329_g1209_i0~~NODE_1346_length_1575_cov_25.923329_g1209_i0.p1  ORF type:complete len:506 (+),score=87.53 NODE_1346_length_1575_cov_25.923329_g1209_i0:10-1527(+)
MTEDNNITQNRKRNVRLQEKVVRKRTVKQYSTSPKVSTQLNRSIHTAPPCTLRHQRRVHGVRKGAQKWQASATKLPFDVLVVVMEFFLDVITLCHCSRVCSAWQAAANSDIVWQGFARALRLKQLASGLDVKKAYIDRVYSNARKRAQTLWNAARNSRDKSLKNCVEKLKLTWALSVNARQSAALAGTRVFSSAVCLRCIDLPGGFGDNATSLQRLQLDVYSIVLGCRARVVCAQIPPRPKWILVQENAAVQFFEVTGAASHCSIIVALWSGTATVASIFISVSSPAMFATLCQMNSYRSTPCLLQHAPVLDDIDPRYGLHGYTVDISLRTPGTLKAAYVFHDAEFLPRELPDIGQRHRQTAGQTRDSKWFTMCLLRRNQTADAIWRMDDTRQKCSDLSVPCTGGTIKTVVPNCTVVDIALWDEHGECMWACTRMVALDVMGDQQLAYDHPEGRNLMGQVHDGDLALRFSLIHLEDDDGLPRNVMSELLCDVSANYLNRWHGTSY